MPLTKVYPINGEVMGWLNSDDKYLPWALHVTGEALRKIPPSEWTPSWRCYFQRPYKRRLRQRTSIKNCLYHGRDGGWDLR